VELLTISVYAFFSLCLNIFVEIKITHKGKNKIYHIIRAISKSNKKKYRRSRGMTVHFPSIVRGYFYEKLMTRILGPNLPDAGVFHM